MLTLSNSFLRAGRLEEAERMARQGLKIRMAKFDASSVPVAGARIRLGQVLLARKKYAEADGLLRQAAEVLMKETGPSGQNTQLAIQTRVELYKAWGKPAEAKAQEALLAQAPRNPRRRGALAAARSRALIPDRARASISFMGRDAREILDDALQLSPEERAALAGRLIESLDRDVDEDAETAWSVEISRRLAEVIPGRSRRSGGRKPGVRSSDRRMPIRAVENRVGPFGVQVICRG